MFISVKHEDKKAIQNIISWDVWLFVKKGFSSEEATKKALEKNKPEIVLYKVEAEKAHKTTVYTTLDSNRHTGMKPFEVPLKAIYADVNSFYGKARTIDDGETISLISYSSCVLSYNRRKNTLLQNYLTKCSATTRRHVSEFLRQLFGKYGSTIVYEKLD